MTVPYVPLQAHSTPVEYEYGPDSFPRPGAPLGRVLRGEVTMAAYPGARHPYLLHLPAETSDLHGVMVVLDGPLYFDPKGPVRGATALDNLHADGRIPSLATVFVGAGEPGLRNVQYDDHTDTFATALIEAVRDIVKRHDIPSTTHGWAIVGGSSGGSGALNIAWQRPEVFSRVGCFLGSFPQMLDGQAFPARILEEPPQQLRVFMLVATHDLGAGEPQDNWFASGLQVAAALNQRGYDHRLVVGAGGHDCQHTGVLFPDVVRWLWSSEV